KNAGIAHGRHTASAVASTATVAKNVTPTGASVPVAGSAGIVHDIAAVIVANKAHLPEIDGLIGDGDHGINMAKGFGRASDRIPADAGLDQALRILSDVLMSEIGGSMGPLYGFMFQGMADEVAGRPGLDADVFAEVLNAGLKGVRKTGSAQVGDKTLIDCLVPAVAAFDAAKARGLAPALAAMSEAAVKGRD